MLVHSRSVTIPPSVLYPLYITANCYTPSYPESTPRDPNAVILVLLHSAGFHKEMFEPTISELFGTMDQSHGKRPHTFSSFGLAGQIREIWSIECPTHGQSAVLNEDEIRKAEYDEKCS